MKLPPNVQAWPSMWLEAFEERAAIVEFQGNHLRPEAERLAEAMVRKEYATWLAQQTGVRP